MYKYPLGTLVKTSHQVGMIVEYHKHQYIIEWYFNNPYRFTYSEDIVESFVDGMKRFKDRNYDNPNDW